MSELRPATPALRPGTARPRSDVEPEVAAPTAEELHSMLRHLACLPAHAGATVVDDPVVGALLIRQHGAGPAGNYAAVLRWKPAAWRPSLAQVMHLYRRWGSWPSLLVADRLDQPPGLGEALDRIGWRSVLSETVLWAGRASVVPHLDSALRIEAVQPGSVADHEAVEREVFGLPDEMAAARRETLATALATGSLRAFVIRVAGEPIAVARLSQGQGVAGLYAIGVREGWRGRGYGTLLTTVATRAGLALGNRLAWLSVEDGNAGARRVYERLGFREAFRWARWLSTDG